MSKKFMIGLGVVIGSLLGGYIPILFGSDALSFSSLIFSALGGLLGIWLGYRLGE